MSAPVVARKRGDEGQPEDVAIKAARLLRVVHRNEDVIQREAAERSHGARIG
jgi:hypothetical protein